MREQGSLKGKFNKKSAAKGVVKDLPPQSNDDVFNVWHNFTFRSKFYFIIPDHRLKREKPRET